MKVIYHCYGGTHTSIVAAHIHLKKLNSNQVPSVSEMYELAYFDNLSYKDFGKLHFIGFDEKFNEIYSCGFKHSAYIAKNAIKDILKIYNLNYKDLYFVSTLKLINLNIRLGGFLSRKLGLVRLGRPLAIKGVRSDYFKISAFVEKVKDDLERDHQKEKV